MLMKKSVLNRGSIPLRAIARSEQTSYEAFGIRLINGLPEQKSFEPEIFLPSTIYALVGQELNIYFDNIMNDRDTDYDFVVSCTIGEQLNNCYRVTPETAGTYPIVIKAYQDGTESTRITSSIIVTDASVGIGINKKVLVIGDSTTASGILCFSL